MCALSLLIIKTIVLILPLLANGQLFFGNNQENSNGNTNPVNINIRNLIGHQNVNVQTRFQNPRKGQSCTTPDGNSGTCNFIFDSQCNKVLSAIRILGITQQVLSYLVEAIRSPCGFEQSDYTLCCVGKYVLFSFSVNYSNKP